ncbi:MAG: hypothetical protein JST17_07510 [Bacteroidetes bacterium]|nr:hypothetical protein [Bacteroidota bacterium]MBS1931634.1 hypothetical protein [Bacteroidota bacterium]
MTQRDNILQELVELESTLADTTPQNIYSVPDRYFEELANRVVGNIKAFEANDAKEELSHLSSLLSHISKEPPYVTHPGYFDGLAEKILTSIHINQNSQNPKEELETISPFLSGLKKQMPYAVPDGYFEKVISKVPARSNANPETKIIPITHRKWFRYAAAAVVIGFIALGGLLFEHRPGIDPDKNPDEWIAKNVKKVSTDKVDAFIKLADEESNPKGVTTDKEEKPNEIKNLMKDVPESQIQEFINETASLGEDNSVLN